jgi:Na+/H+ antiporter NhaA
LVFGVLAQFGSWAAPFIVAAGLLVVGSVVWAFWLDPDASVVEKYRLPTAADVAAG